MRVTINSENEFFRVCEMLADTVEEDIGKYKCDSPLVALAANLTALEYRVKIILEKRGVI